MADENKEVIRGFIDEVANNGRLDSIDRYFHKDFVDHNPSPGASPDRDGVAHSFALVRKAFSNFHTTIEDLVSEGDKIAYRWTFSGTNTGELQGTPPSGRAASWPTFGIVRIVDGKVAERWQIFDPLGLRVKLGTL